MAIHPTAVVDASAELAGDVEIGAYAVVEGGVTIGAGTRLYPHAYVAFGTTLGARCQVHPFAVVGHPPQDLKFGGAPSYTRVGDETIIREHATIHRGTIPESTTSVGRRCFLMATAHVAHNCAVGDDVKMANGAVLAGHVTVGDGAFISAYAAVHQFVRIGELCMLTGLQRIPQDVAPFMLLGPAGVSGLNLVGLRRAGAGPEERAELRACYRALFRSGLLFREAVRRVGEMARSERGRRLAEFLNQPSRRGYVRFRSGSPEEPSAEAET